MNHDLVVAIVGGLGGMLGWGFADFFAKKTIDKTSDLKTLFWSQLIGIVPLLLIFMVHPAVPHLNRFDIPFLILFGAISGLSYLPVYAGFGKGQVSLLSPVFASWSVVVVLLSALFFGETLPALRWLAVAITFAGILAISADPRDIRRMLRGQKHSVRGLPEIFVALITYSVWLVFFNRFLSGKPWVFYLLVIRIFSTATLYLYSRIRRLGLAFKQQDLWKYMALIGVFDVMAFGFVSYGFSASSLTSVVAILAGTFSLPTMVLARIYLKEKITPLHAFAALLILLGVAIISLE